MPSPPIAHSETYVPTTGMTFSFGDNDLAIQKIQRRDGVYLRVPACQAEFIRKELAGTFNEVPVVPDYRMKCTCANAKEDGHEHEYRDAWNGALLYTVRSSL